MDTVTLFVDTNAFIQLNDLKDLDWRKLFRGVKHIRLMVARTVVEELDKQKTKTKDRQRNRARAALKLIAEASRADGRILTLKKTPILVTLEIPPRVKLDWDSLSLLDPTKSDDRLVAEAHTYGNDAAIFSHDGGPRITAEDLGMKAYEPLQEWHLPDELSDSDKKIALLERQLKAAQSTKPALKIEIEGRDESRNLILYRPIVPPLNEEAIERLTDALLREHPRASPQSTVSRYGLKVIGRDITDSQVDRYHDEYDAFEEKVRKLFRGLHEQVRHWLVVPSISMRVENEGSVSAMNFHVTLQTSGSIALVASASEIQKFCSFPEPPKTPSPWKAFDLPVWHSPHLFAPSEPHPTKIVWIDRPELGDTSAQLGCKDFQPGRSYEREVTFWVEDELPAQGTLTIIAGANDVPDISETVGLTIEEREDSWQSPLVIESLPSYLHSTLKRLKWDDATHAALKRLGRKVRARVTKFQPKG